MAPDKGIRFCSGSDAHKSEDVGVLLGYLQSHDTYGKALEPWLNE